MFFVSYSMKLLISGSRQFTDKKGLVSAVQLLEKELNITFNFILHGGAKGADTLAEVYAQSNGIPTKVIVSNYDRYFAKVAPLKRNELLVQEADAILVLYGFGGKQGGSFHVAQLARANNIFLCERFVDGRIQFHKPSPILF